MVQRDEIVMEAPDQAPPQPESARIWLASAASFLIALAVNFWVGLIVFMGDSLLIANRAKSIAQSGNFNLDNGLGGLIYPPLYALLISPAYLSRTPETSFQVILAIHALLVASQVWPFAKLLEEYANLSRKHAAILAVCLSLAPFSLPYASMMLTEVVYVPLLLWMTYFFLRTQSSSAPKDAAWTGCFLGLMLLSRSAASTVLVAFVAATIYSAWQAKADRVQNHLRSLIIGLAAFGAVFGSWKLFEKLFVVYATTPASYFTLEDIRIIFREGKRLDHHAAWLTNTFFYYLTAPLSMAGCFFYALLFRKPKQLMRDPLVPFAVLSLVVSAVTVVLVMTQGWGGRDLTWNKYLAPYVFLIVLTALRYRASFNRSLFRASAMILTLIVLAFKPSGLGCHFTDALVLFTNNSNPLQIPETIANLIFLAVLLLPAWLWLRNSESLRKVAIGWTAALWAVSLFGVAKIYRNSGDLNISAYNGIAKQALALQRQAPDTQVFYDPAFAAKDFFGALRIPFYWPTHMQAATPEQVAAFLKTNQKPVLYFTDQDIAPASELGKDRGAVALVSLRADALPAAAAPQLPPTPGSTAMTVELGPNVAGQESTTFQGKKYAVSWLQRDTALTIVNPGPETHILLQFQLAIPDRPRTMQLRWNGALTGESHIVNKVFWASGPQAVTFRIRVKPGRNTATLTTADPLTELPGGRQVAALLIGDVVAASATN